MSLIDDLKAAHKAATPGPWGPDVYVTAPEVPGAFGDGNCKFCRQLGVPIVRSQFDIYGRVITAHVHVDGDEPNPHTLVHFDGERPPVTVAGNYDYQDGGIVSPEDTKLIALVRNALPEILNAITLVDRLAAEGHPDAGAVMNGFGRSER